VTPTFIYKALHGEPLPLENGGVSTRDFIFVDDICLGLIAIATKGQPGDVYNLASGRETSILQLANAINEMTGNRAGVHHLPARSWDRSGKRFGSTQKARAELGYFADVELAEGLRRTIEWTKANMATIEACVRKHATHLASTG
jgi:nucleoside-diphosphate-sugar epimerase